MVGLIRVFCMFTLSVKKFRLREKIETVKRHHKTESLLYISLSYTISAAPSDGRWALWRVICSSLPAEKADLGGKQKGQNISRFIMTFKKLYFVCIWLPFLSQKKMKALSPQD